MKVKYCSLLLLFFLYFSPLVFTQPYHSALGLRAGTATGISFKHFLGESTAVEALVVYRREGVRSIALVQQHFEIARNSFLYLGIGGHAGYNGLLSESPYTASRPVWGIDAEGGFEYVFPYSPVSFGLHLKPMVELNGERTFSGNNAGASIRLVF